MEASLAPDVSDEKKLPKAAKHADYSIRHEPRWRQSKASRVWLRKHGAEVIQGKVILSGLNH